MSGHPKRIEMKIRSLWSPFGFLFRDVHVADERFLTLLKDWKETKRTEGKSFCQFVQPKNGWSSELENWFLWKRLFFVQYLEVNRNSRFSNEEEFRGKLTCFNPLSLSNRSPLFGVWSTTVVFVCTWLAGCPLVGAWSTSGGSSCWA